MNRMGQPKATRHILENCIELISDSKKVRHRKNFKITHVAFSRPTHLLAFACCNEHVSGHETELEKAGWVIRDLRLTHKA
ncbi:MAG: hypothetical protein D3913_04670 [Candidatus Electrothrix sp. LOE1_4_5]|nr:hypothetical protein [Candidatus Electrothrix gigas]